MRLHFESLTAVGDVRKPKNSTEPVIGTTPEPGPLDQYLTQPAFPEDEEMEGAHVRDEQLHGEQRVRIAITQALATGYKHGGGRALCGRAMLAQLQLGRPVVVLEDVLETAQENCRVRPVEGAVVPTEYQHAH